jgi:hypothetical protein
MKVIPGNRDRLHEEARAALLDCLVHGREDAEARLYEIDGILSRRNVSIVLRHFFREITVEAFPPAPVDPACALPGRQAY